MKGKARSNKGFIKRVVLVDFLVGFQGRELEIRAQDVLRPFVEVPGDGEDAKIRREHDQ